MNYWEFDANGNPPKPKLQDCPLCPDGGNPYFTRTVNGTNMIKVGCAMTNRPATLEDYYAYLDQLPVTHRIEAGPGWWATAMRWVRLKLGLDK